MLEKLKGKLKTEKGQSIVEFAIIVPVLLMLMCGVLDFGWLYMNIYEIDHATYEATRCAEMLIQDGETQTATIQLNATKLVEKNVSDTRNLTTSFAILEPGYGTVTVTHGIKMLTFVGSTFLGNWYTIERSRTFALP